MNLKTIRALVWSAFLLLIVGSMMQSPAGLVMVLGLACVSALFPVVFGSIKFRIAGLLVLLAALLLIVDTYPRARDEMNRYFDHAHGK
ncbi:MAG: hypothetical protein PHP85_11105 [Gallionella sp.]|nr:hypothetical protein [Gallionella sp.]